MNKRGVSEVVSTILIVLLVIIAIGILWAVIGGFIRGKTGSIGEQTKCFSLDLEITSANYTTVISGTPPATTYRVGVKVRRNGGEDLSKIRVLINGEKQADETVTPDILGSQCYSYPGLTSIPTKVEIAGLIGETPCQNTLVEKTPVAA